MSTTHRAIGTAKTIKLGECKSAEIIIIGDTHIGSPFTMSSYFFAIKKWLAEKPNRYAIHTGDLYEAATIGSKGDPYHCLPLDQAEEEAVGWLKSLGDKLICMVDGNHDQRYARMIGKDVVADAACKAGVSYFGDEAYLNVKLGHWDNQSKASRSPVCYCVYVTHGVGGGRTAGSQINSLLRLREIVEADIYIQGHQHDPICKHKSIYQFHGGSIVEKQQVFVVGGSALGRKGYPTQKAYAPTSHDFPVITLSGSRKVMSTTVIPLTYAL